MHEESMTQTFEGSLADAVRLLEAHFGEVDQQAAVLLANALYACQDRERFAHRAHEGETPYSI
ncbi:MAG: hypothetical protein ACYDDF_12470 [Thermoplasmatota archaeon]